jgi:transcriptional regulator with XRE-family HTH domain
MDNDMGAYIRERRQRLGLSQEELAERVGGAYSQSDISRLERGHIGLPRLGTIVRLAASLEVSVGDLLIAAGWFEDELVISSLAPAAAEQDTLETVLAVIEAELDTIRDLEHQATSRSDRLRNMIAQVKATMGGAEASTDHHHDGGDGDVSVVEG